jgi:N-acetylglucosaminyl-diphospho-decaprenol L-rhamnosyltransferase
VTADVAIVMITYNCADWVPRSLGALPAALGSRQAAVVVVDNASSDSGADRAEEAGATVVRNTENAGFAAAVNQGVRAAPPSRWVLLLNPDTEARPGSLERLLAFAEANPGHGLYGGRTLRTDGGLEPSSCWGEPSLWSMVCFATGLSTALPGRRLTDPESLGSWQRDSTREVGVITGCLLLVDRDVWDELGGMDERYFVYGEDVDFSTRARKQGYRPIITPDAEVVHAIGVSSADNPSKVRLVLAGKVTYVRLNWPGWRGQAGLSLLWLGVAGRALGARLTGRGRGWGAGWSDRAQWWNGFDGLRPAAGPPVGDPEA